MERMADGLLILDVEKRVVDLNPLAEKILGPPKGASAGEMPPSCPRALQCLRVSTAGRRHHLRSLLAPATELATMP